MACTSFPYVISRPKTYSGVNNLVITGTLFQCSGSQPGLTLNNCTNVTITNCAFGSLTYYSLTEIGLSAIGCSNLYITNCYAENVASGFLIQNCNTVVVDSNQGRNMMGPFPRGNFVQFINVNGTGSSISNNRVENEFGVGSPQDIINVYKSNGTPSSLIQVNGNWVRGGQVYQDSGGGAGIVLGDVGGSYQIAQNNIMVNAGAVGMQIQGGTFCTMTNNKVYRSGTFGFSFDGMAYGNYSGVASNNITMSLNTVKWIRSNGTRFDMFFDTSNGTTLPFGWSTNITGSAANIDASILPTNVVTYCPLSQYLLYGYPVRSKYSSTLLV